MSLKILSTAAQLQEQPANQPTTVLRPLYRSTCVSQHLQLRTGGFCCLCPHALADGNQHIQIREKTLEFSTPQQCIYTVSVPHHNCENKLYSKATKIEAMDHNYLTSMNMELDGYGQPKKRKCKHCDISATVRPIFTKFNTMKQNTSIKFTGC